MNNKDMPDGLYVCRGERDGSSYCFAEREFTGSIRYVRADLAPAPKTVEDKYKSFNYSSALFSIEFVKIDDGFVYLRSEEGMEFKVSIPPTPPNAALDGLLWMKQIIESKGDKAFDEHDLEATYEEIQAALRNTETNG